MREWHFHWHFPADEGGRRPVSVEPCLSCVTFSPLPAASGSLQRGREILPHFPFPGGPVFGGYFPSAGVDAQRFEVALQVSLYRSCGRPVEVLSGWNSDPV